MKRYYVSGLHLFSRHEREKNARITRFHYLKIETTMVSNGYQVRIFYGGEGMDIGIYQWHAYGILEVANDHRS